MLAPWPQEAASPRWKCWRLGTTCHLNHSLTSTTPDMVRASIVPQAEIGLRQVFAKELRCRTPSTPHHPLNLDQSLAAFQEEFNRWDGAYGGRVRMGMVIETNAHWVAAGMSTEELITQGYQLARRLGVRISAHIAGGHSPLKWAFSNICGGPVARTCAI